MNGNISHLKKVFAKFQLVAVFWRNFVLSKFYVETGRLNRDKSISCVYFLRKSTQPSLFQIPPLHPQNPTIVIVVVIVKISQIRIYVYFVFEFLTKKCREREQSKSVREKSSGKGKRVSNQEAYKKWESINCNLYCNLGKRHDCNCSRNKTGRQRMSQRKREKESECHR